MIQLCLDKFGVEQKKQVIPAELNTVLKRPKAGEILAHKDQSKYWSDRKNDAHDEMVKAGHIQCDL